MEERILVVATTEKEEKALVLVLDGKVFSLTVDAVWYFLEYPDHDDWSMELWNLRFPLRTGWEPSSSAEVLKMILHRSFGSWMKVFLDELGYHF